MASGTLLPYLRAQGLSPRKSLGQHYLTDRGILDAIVAAAELPSDAVVIEVGPGPGTLTAALLPHVARLIAIELDDHLAPLLSAHFGDWPQFHLLHADALTLAPSDALLRTGGMAPYSLVANLPYYITSALLRHYLESAPHRGPTAANEPFSSLGAGLYPTPDHSPPAPRGFHTTPQGSFGSAASRSTGATLDSAGKAPAVLRHRARRVWPEAQDASKQLGSRLATSGTEGGTGAGRRRDSAKGSGAGA